MTTRNTQEVVQELYGVEVSPTLVSEISARRWPASSTVWTAFSMDWMLPSLDQCKKQLSKLSSRRYKPS
jgi:hypothetical protein